MPNKTRNYFAANPNIDILSRLGLDIANLPELPSTNLAELMAPQVTPAKPPAQRKRLANLFGLLEDKPEVIVPERLKGRLGPEEVAEIETPPSETGRIIQALSLIPLLFGAAPLAFAGGAIGQAIKAGGRKRKEATLERAAGEQADIDKIMAAAQAKAAYEGEKGQPLTREVLTQLLATPGIKAPYTAEQISAAQDAIQKRSLEAGTASAIAAGQIRKREQEEMPINLAPGMTGLSWVDPKSGEFATGWESVKEVKSRGLEKLTANAATAYKSSIISEKSVATLTNLLVSRNKLPKDWKERPVQALKNLGEVFLQSDPVLTTVARNMGVQAVRAIRAQGEVGNLSRSDVLLALALMPKVTDTLDVVLLKQSVFADLMQTSRQGLLGKFGESSAQKAVKLLGQARLIDEQDMAHAEETIRKWEQEKAAGVRGLDYRGEAIIPTDVWERALGRPVGSPAVWGKYPSEEKGGAKEQPAEMIIEGYKVRRKK